VGNTGKENWHLLKSEESQTRCRPRDTLVKVEAGDSKLMLPSMPTDVCRNTTYVTQLWPHCVSLKRCGGCCGPRLTCVPADGDDAVVLVEKAVGAVYSLLKILTF
jgi:hypothetical protein